MGLQKGQRHSGQFKPGNPGKPKGALNPLSKSVKETVLEVFNALQIEGGSSSLKEWATQDPGEFYKIAAKLIPTDIKADVKTVQKITLNVVRAGTPLNLTDASPEPAEGTE
jgi:hypothetical protein